MNKKTDIQSEKQYECLWFEDEENPGDDLMFLEELFGSSEGGDVLIETGLPVLHC